MNQKSSVTKTSNLSQRCRRQTTISIVDVAIEDETKLKTETTLAVTMYIRFLGLVSRVLAVSKNSRLLRSLDPDKHCHS